MAQPAPLLELRTRDIVVIGASAGGVQVLAEIAERLPSDFGAAIFVVLHLPEDSPSSLADILDRAGPLASSWAAGNRPITPGTITVAPPNYHLVLERDRVQIVRGPKVNGYRPAVDVLFHSAARAHAGNVVGVVLSGALNDGTLGLRAVKRRDGFAIVQSDAVHEGMPTSAIQNVDVDAVLPANEIPGMLTMLAGRREGETVEDSTVPESELEAGFDVEGLRGAPGSPTILRCPECGGALWELEDGEFSGYACHVGHTYSTDSMIEEQTGATERALWNAVVMLEEKAALSTRLSERMRMRGGAKSSRQFEDTARAASEQADAIRRLLDESQ